MLSEADEKFWRRMRLWYDKGRWVIGGVFAVYFIPNLILFGKWTRISPADYVSAVQTRCVPIVKAILEYERDRGEVPKDVNVLVPKYLPTAPPIWLYVSIRPQQIDFFTVLHNEDVVEYLFLPPASGKLEVHLGLNTPYQIPAPTAGWYMMSGFGSGQVPLPAVTIDAATQPSTMPN